MTFGKPTPLTEEEVEDIIDRFAYGAEVLYKAGADGVQLRKAFAAPRTMLLRKLTCQQC